MGFQQGLSGLNAASKGLEAIGNNVANANTVGYKQAQAQFADVYAASLTGAGAGQIGIGTKLANVAQQFTQGNITSSNNPLDIAINGGGFFRVSSGGTIGYTRNGQFSLDREGYIVNTNGARLTGYIADAQGVLSTGAPTDLNINTSDLRPEQTGEIKSKLNLDANKIAKDNTITPFNYNDPTTYHNASSVTVYDSLGKDHIVQMYYVKRLPLVTDPALGTVASPPGTQPEWDIYASIDGVLIDGNPAGTGQVGTLRFRNDGTIDTGFGTGARFADVQFTVSNGAVTPINNDPTGSPPTAGIMIDLTGTTQYGSAFSVNALSQNGYASGRLSGFNVSADGTIVGRYSNGKSATLGQLVLASFNNPNGLQALGNNTWVQSATSGEPLVGTPGSGALGQLSSSSVEDSNVDLTAELVNMITAQRIYQANAQTIKTQDQVLQTLVNLR